MSNPHNYPVVDHLCDDNCLPDPTCDNTTSWDVMGEQLVLECSLPDRHPEPWHYDEAAHVWFDKYSDNKTADMEAVEKYVDYRVEQALQEYKATLTAEELPF